VADPFGYLGDDGVAEASQSVHPVGNPMSHSTHVGFNCPVSPEWFTAVASVMALLAPDGRCPPRSFDTRPPVASDDSGVGHRPLLAIAGSDRRTAAPGDGDWLEPYSVAVGVGNHDPGSRLLIEGEPWFAFDVGVCNNEDAVTEVRGTNGGSRDAVPFRVVPELGQISEYSSEPQGKVPWHVLQQRVSGS
jgi:hypothetical protein